MSRRKLKFYLFFTFASLFSFGLFINGRIPTEFDVQVINQNFGKNSKDYSQTLSCVEEIKFKENSNQLKGNKYETDTTTFTAGDHLTVVKNDILQVKFSRDPNDRKRAFGGRCVTEGSTSIFGDGEFSARLFIHSNILESDGVFTIAILPNKSFLKEKDFKKNYELDLVVINLLDIYGRPVIKFGNPGKSVSVSLEEIVNRKQWITVKMIRKSEVCKLELYTDSGRNLFKQDNLPCAFGDKKEILNGVENLNRVVINARARDYENSGSSHISISDVKWVRYSVRK